MFGGPVGAFRGANPPLPMPRSGPVLCSCQPAVGGAELRFHEKEVVRCCCHRYVVAEMLSEPIV